MCLQNCLHRQSFNVSKFEKRMVGTLLTVDVNKVKVDFCRG